MLTVACLYWNAGTDRCANVYRYSGDVHLFPKSALFRALQGRVRVVDGNRLRRGRTVAPMGRPAKADL